MRNFLMITTAVYGLSVFAPAISQAQTCTVAPSCADMGYDKTAADCEGKKMLKCPFDLTAVSCEEGGSGDVIDMANLAWAEAERICAGDSRITTTTIDDDCDSTNNTFTLHADGCINYNPPVKEYRPNRDINSAYINNIYATLNADLVCFKKGTVVNNCSTWGYPVGSSGGEVSGCLTFIPAKSSKKPLSECEDGDFYYADDMCSPNSLSEIPLGVIIDKDKRLVLGWGPKYYNSNWYLSGDTSLTNYTTIETAITDMNGKYNTEILYNLGLGKATDCIELERGGKEWFIPSAGQLNNILTKYDLIKPQLDIYAPREDFGNYHTGNHFSEVLQTSTEYDSSYIWGLNQTSKTFEKIKKSQSYSTVCVFQY